MRDNLISQEQAVASLISSSSNSTIMDQEQAQEFAQLGFDLSLLEPTPLGS
jgi:hypothetical protein